MSSTLFRYIFRDLLPHAPASEATADFDRASDELVVDYRLSANVPEPAVAPDIFAIGPNNFHAPLKISKVAAGHYRARLNIGQNQGLFRIRPLADSPAFPQRQLAKALPEARFASAKELDSLLTNSPPRLLVLPYGSAFPEDDWAEIQGFLHRGGNLLVLGGRPFSRAAYRDGTTWKLRDYSVRYTRPLMIDQYQETPGSDGLKFESNPDIPLGIPQFSW